jgi:hypothetical protein
MLWIAPACSRAAENLPAAHDLLGGCIGALPDIPLLVTGELQSRSADGDLEKKIGVEMLLDWQADPPTARYTTRDAFGHTLEHLAITWPADQAPEYRFLKGDPLQAAPPPDLSGPVAGTDIGWNDLSLSFLWRTDGTTIGAEDVRGRACFVVDLPGSNAQTRLWIDPRIPILLRAETFNNGERTRRMDVKGFKKINDRWVIHNVEVERFQPNHKTILRVRDVQDRSRKDYIKVDDAPAEDAPPVQGVDGL